MAATSLCCSFSLDAHPHLYVSSCGGLGGWDKYKRGQGQVSMGFGTQTFVIDFG